MSFLSEDDNAHSMTRLSLAVVLFLIVLSVTRWVCTGDDIPRGVSDLLGIALGVAGTAKVAQKFAEK
jgi:hypothetical protein